ncbi:MAG: helix-turn-helix transcriptional regulator [bacterium]
MRLKNVELVIAMVAAGLTGRALAARCGLNPITISHILNQRTEPKPETAQAIAQVFGSTPERFGWALKGVQQ